MYNSGGSTVLAERCRVDKIHMSSSDSRLTRITRRHKIASPRGQELMACIVAFPRSRFARSRKRQADRTRPPMLLCLRTAGIQAENDAEQEQGSRRRMPCGIPAYWRSVIADTKSICRADVRVYQQGPGKGGSGDPHALELLRHLGSLLLGVETMNDGGSMFRSHNSKKPH